MARGSKNYDKEVRKVNKGSKSSKKVKCIHKMVEALIVGDADTASEEFSNYMKEASREILLDEAKEDTNSEDDSEADTDCDDDSDDECDDDSEDDDSEDDDSEDDDSEDDEDDEDDSEDDEDDSEDDSSSVKEAYEHKPRRTYKALDNEGESVVAISNIASDVTEDEFLEHFEAWLKKHCPKDYKACLLYTSPSPRD